MNAMKNTGFKSKNKGFLVVGCAPEFVILLVVIVMFFSLTYNFSKSRVYDQTGVSTVDSDAACEIAIEKMKAEEVCSKGFEEINRTLSTTKPLFSDTRYVCEASFKCK